MTGLVGHWPLTEWSGRANDLSGNENHGTLFNNVTQSVAGVGGLTAYSFEGTDSGVRIADSADFDLTNNVSLSIWFRANPMSDFSSASTVEKVLLAKTNDWAGGTTQSYGLYYNINGSTPSVRAGVSDGSSTQIIGDDVEAEEWFHAVMTFSDGAYRIYVNGELRESINSLSSLQTTNLDLMIGAADTDTDRYFSGELADARLYGRELGSDEVKALYAMGSVDATDPRLHDGSHPAAVLRWPFDGQVAGAWGTSPIDDTSAGFTDGVRGQAKSFDGSDDKVTIDGDPIDGDNGPFTYSMWIRPTGYSGAGSRGDDVFGDSGARKNIYYRDNNDVFLRTWDGSGGQTMLIGQIPANTGWRHVCVTFDGSTARGYINGVQTASKAMSYQHPNGDVGICARANGTGSGWFQGDVDDARLYTRPLSPPEVRQLYLWGTRGRDMASRTVVA